MLFTDYKKFVRLGALQTYQPRPKGLLMTTPDDADKIRNPRNTLDISNLTFDQAEQIIAERNRRREAYGESEISIPVNFGTDSTRRLERANGDRKFAPHMPASFWGQLLHSMEDASNDPSSYLARRKWVLMTEALRESLREQGF